MIHKITYQEEKSCVDGVKCCYYQQGIRLSKNDLRQVSP